MKKRNVKIIAYHNQLQVTGSQNPRLDGVKLRHDVVDMGTGSDPHCNAYSHIDGAILDKSCNAFPHPALSHP